MKQLLTFHTECMRRCQLVVMSQLPLVVTLTPTYGNVRLHVVAVVKPTLGQITHMIDIERQEHGGDGANHQPVLCSQNSET